MKKVELLDALESSREMFLEMIDELPDEDFEVPGVIGEWSLKDILAHLTRWEAELVKLLWQASRGHVPSSAHFGKIDVDTLNGIWYNEMHSRRLDQILEDFHSVRNQTMRRIEDFSDKDLTDAKRYRWLRGKPLFEWIAADSFKHEGEHAQHLKAWKARKKDN